MLDVTENESYASPLTIHININARTRDLHCEKDVSYKIIQVPPQVSIEAYIVERRILNFFICIKADSMFPYVIRKLMF